MILYRITPKEKSDAYGFDTRVCTRCLKKLKEKGTYKAEKLYEQEGYCNYCGKEN